jgi:hypothetical protein
VTIGGTLAGDRLAVVAAVGLVTPLLAAGIGWATHISASGSAPSALSLVIPIVTLPILVFLDGKSADLFLVIPRQCGRLRCLTSAEPQDHLR